MHLAQSANSGVIRYVPPLRVMSQTGDPAAKYAVALEGNSQRVTYPLRSY